MRTPAEQQDLTIHSRRRTRGKSGTKEKVQAVLKEDLNENALDLKMAETERQRSWTVS